MRGFPVEEYQARVSKLQTNMHQKDIDAIKHKGKEGKALYNNAKALQNK